MAAQKRSFCAALEVFSPATGSVALEVLHLAAAAAPLGEPDPLEVQHLEDDQRHDPRHQLGLGKDVHSGKLPARSAGRNGSDGLFSGAGRPTPDRDSPRAPGREQLIGVDLVRPAEKVLLRLVASRPVHRAPIGVAARGLERLAALEGVEPRLCSLCDRSFFVAPRHVISVRPRPQRQALRLRRRARG